MTAEGLSASLEEHPRAAGIRGSLRSREKEELDRIYRIIRIFVFQSQRLNIVSIL